MPLERAGASGIRPRNCLPMCHGNLTSHGYRVSSAGITRSPDHSLGILGQGLGDSQAPSHTSGLLFPLEPGMGHAGPSQEPAQSILPASFFAPRPTAGPSPRMQPVASLTNVPPPAQVSLTCQSTPPRPGSFSSNPLLRLLPRPQNSMAPMVTLKDMPLDCGGRGSRCRDTSGPHRVIVQNALAGQVSAASRA